MPGVRPIWCPGCKRALRPVLRVAGYPTLELQEEIARGDAIAVGCDPSAGRAPAQCRGCRRVLIPGGTPVAEIVESIAGDPCLALDAQRTLWASERGRVLVGVLRTTERVLHPSDAMRAALGSARAPRLALVHPAWPVRIGSGRGLRDALASSAPLVVVRPLLLAAGVHEVTLRLRPR